MAVIKLSPRKDDQEKKYTIKLSPKKDYRSLKTVNPVGIDPKAGLLYARCYADEKRTFDQWRKGEPREWKRVEKFNDIALIVPDGIIVLDFDDPDDISRAHAIIKEKGLKCRMVESHTGSLHAYFKSPIRSEKTTKQLLHCGLTCDWQSGVRGATAMVRLDGRDYKVLQDIPVFDTCELPRYFEKAGSKQPQFLHMKEGSRNDSIFRHIWRLQTMGLTKSEVTETIHIINDHMLGDK